MKYNKGFAAMSALIGVGLIILAGVWYMTMNQRNAQPLLVPEAAQESEQEATNTKSSIAWQFKDAGEVDAMPKTAVTVVVNGTPYDMGTFTGSSSEIGATGGVDGTGLLAGELSAAQCWFAGGGDEIGVFASEDGGFEIMVGELGEGEAGEGLFRGNFSITHVVRL